MTRHTLIAGLITWFSLVGIGPASAQDIVNIEPYSFCPGDTPTVVEYSLPADSYVQITVYNALAAAVVVLVDGMEAAGLHSVVWNGLDDEGLIVPVGWYSVRLDTDPSDLEHDDEEDVDVFCGNDLAEPIRLIHLGQDLLIAFGYGLEVPQNSNLAIRSADGSQHVRTIAGGPHDAGAGMGFWFLRDENDERVPPGDYLARLTATHYTQDLPFSVLTWENVYTMSVTMRDADGILVAGSEDAEAAPVVRTPILETTITIDTPLTPQLFGIVAAVWQEHGSLANFAAESVTISSDSTVVTLAGFEEPDQWPDRYGLGWFQLPLPWISPTTAHFHLRHEFTGVTHTDHDCQINGPVDPTDWLCGEPYWIEDDDDTPEDVFLSPACPNPANHDTDGSTTLGFGLPAALAVRLYAIDTQGHRVRNLVEGALLPGQHLVTWNLRDDEGADLPGGLYRVILEAGPSLEETTVFCGGDVEIASISGVGDQSFDTAGLNLAAAPNPVWGRGRTELMCAPGRGGGLELKIYDVAGRLVRTLLQETVAGGQTIPVEWDGRDDRGARVPAGVFFARLTVDGESRTEKIVVVQ